MTQFEIVIVKRSSFFFNDTATTEIYTLSLHDALPISGGRDPRPLRRGAGARGRRVHREPPARPRQPRAAGGRGPRGRRGRSEEHTSELQSRQYLVCRLLLEKKKQHLGLTIIYSHSLRP